MEPKTPWQPPGAVIVQHDDADERLLVCAADALDVPRFMPSIYERLQFFFVSAGPIEDVSHKLSHAAAGAPGRPGEQPAAVGQKQPEVSRPIGRVNRQGN